MKVTVALSVALLALHPPVALALAAPVTAPVAAPMTTPMTTPVAAPATAPVAASVTAPVTAPAATPVTAPVTTPVQVSGRVENTDCEPVWDRNQNFFGINRDFYNSHSELFKVGGRIVADGTTYYIDAMNLPGNCNSKVALVYVANKANCVDGTPWVWTSECLFGGVLTADLHNGVEWYLLPGTAQQNGTDTGTTPVAAPSGTSPVAAPVAAPSAASPVAAPAALVAAPSAASPVAAPAAAPSAAPSAASPVAAPVAAPSAASPVAALAAAPVAAPLAAYPVALALIEDAAPRTGAAFALLLASTSALLLQAC